MLYRSQECEKFPDATLFGDFADAMQNCDQTNLLEVNILSENSKISAQSKFCSLGPLFGQFSGPEAPK